MLRSRWRPVLGYDWEDQVRGAHSERLEQHQLSARAREPDQQAVDSGYRTSIKRPLATEMKLVGMSIVTDHSM